MGAPFMIQPTQTQQCTPPVILFTMQPVHPLTLRAADRYVGLTPVSETAPYPVNSLWAAPRGRSSEAGGSDAAPPPAGSAGDGAGRGRKKTRRRIDPDALRSLINIEHSEDNVRRTLGENISAEALDALCAAAKSSVANPRPVKYLGIYASNGDEAAIDALATLRFEALEGVKKASLAARVDRTFRHIDRPLIREIFAALESGEDPAQVAALRQTEQILRRAEAGSIESYFSLRNFALAFEPFRLLLKNLKVAKWAEFAEAGDDLAMLVLKDLAQNFKNESAEHFVGTSKVVMEWPTANIFETVRDDTSFLKEFGEMDPGHTAGTRDELIAFRIKTERGDIDAACALIARIRNGQSHATAIAARTNFSAIEDIIDEQPGNLRAINVLAAFAEVMITTTPIDALIRLMLDFRLISELRRFAIIIQEKLAAIDRSVYRESVERDGNSRALDGLFRLSMYVPAVLGELKSLDVSGLRAVFLLGDEHSDAARIAIRDLARIGNQAAISASAELEISLT